MDDKEIIRTGIERLCSGNLDNDDFILLIYNKVLKTNEDKELIADFLEYLNKYGNRFILTTNDLMREFSRSRIPAETRKLWGIISAALLSLEKRNVVFRSENDQKYNNSNNTTWWEGKCSTIAAIDPSKFTDSVYFSQKKQRKGGSLLTPTDAEKLVLAIFSTYECALKMDDIFYITKRYMKSMLIPFSESLDAPLDAESVSNSLHDTSAGRDLQDYTAEIKEEAESRVSLIWEGISKICRGTATKVTGSKIFCLYFMPKYSKISSPNLEDFGPKSTVGDVEKDVRAILKEYLTFEDDHDNQSIADEIQKDVFVLLNRVCSEKGHVTSLDI